MERGYKIRVMLGLLLGGLLISGCVSLTQYNKLKEQYTKDKKLFEEHRVALVKSNSGLKTGLAKYENTEADNIRLNAKIRATNEAMAKLRNDIGRIIHGESGVFAVGRSKIEIQGDVLFSPGRAELKETGKDVLAKIAEVFKQNPDYYIRIEGHTDTDPIRHSKWPTRSNFELAAYRALKVLLYFEEIGIDPARMYLASYGQYQPLVANDSSENKAKNRRVIIGFEEIVLEEPGGDEEPRK